MDITADNSTALAVTNNNNVSIYLLLIWRQVKQCSNFSAQIISIAFKTNPIAYTTANNMLFPFWSNKGTNTSVA
jgi:hypothetical protein